MRYPLVIGNLKLNGNKYMIKELLSSLCKEFKDFIGCDIVIIPPMIYLHLATYYLNNSQIYVGAQNVDINLSGAFTGEISAEMLKDIGIKYVIIGHSERRIYHKENDNIIAKKFAVLKELDLIPIFCIGESENDNKTGKTEIVCMHQINAVLKNLGVQAFKNTIIAYEPIWAIGTGKSATPLQAQKVSNFIRNYIANYDPIIAEQIIIEYGGSVNASNAFQIFTQPDIDGALVGSASLVSDSFSSIVRSAMQAKKIGK